jgi:hypothetical protein
MKRLRLGSALVLAWLATAARAQPPATLPPATSEPAPPPRLAPTPADPHAGAHPPHAEAAHPPAGESLLDLKSEPLVPGHAEEQHHAEHSFEAPPEPEEAKRLRFRAEYLLWYVKNSPIPALITLGSATDPVPAGLGQPGTTTVFGGGDVNNYNRSGGRFALGYWFGEEERFGFEADYLFLASRAVRFELNSSGLPGSPVIGRPFINVAAPGGPTADVALVALTGLAGGHVEARSTNFVQSAEVNGLWNFRHDPCFRVDGLAGFRYAQLDESIGVDSRSNVALGTPTFGGQTISISDRFDAANHFYGGQLGARAEVKRGRWSLEGLGKVAFGTMFEDLRIRGSTVFTMPDGTAVARTGGLLALSSNIGDQNRTTFAVVPEAGLTLGYTATDHLRFTFGYSFLYLSRVVRPGEHIDLGINPNLAPISLTAGTPGGPARPSSVLTDSDFWAQGLSFGAEFKY